MSAPRPSDSTARANRGRDSRSRSPPRERAARQEPMRTVMVFPTRDGEHITITLTIGKSNRHKNSEEF